MVNASPRVSCLHVGERGEPGALPEAVPALGSHLHLGDGLAEGCRPGVEVPDPGGFQQVGAQVALHDVRFGDAVGDRGGGGEGDHPGTAPAAQVADLHVQVAGPGGPVDRRVGDVGRGAQVLVSVGLVDEQVVDPGCLEGDPRVLSGVELPFDPLSGRATGDELVAAVGLEVFAMMRATAATWCGRGSAHPAHRVVPRPAPGRACRCRHRPGSRQDRSIAPTPWHSGFQDRRRSGPGWAADLGERGSSWSWCSSPCRVYTVRL